MQNGQLMKSRCRIYVGSLDYSLTESDIRQVFQAFGTIINVEMPKEGGRSKGFCFIEYTVPEAAEMAIQAMQGFQLKNRTIKVGRPTAVTGGGGGGGSIPTPASGPLTATGLPNSGASSGGGMNRIYVGSVPYNFSANDIKEIFQAFGQILSCQLIPSQEKPGTHRGYGFIEFGTMQSAQNAINTMNGFEVGGKQLKVNFATALRNTGGGAMPSPSPAAGLGGLGGMGGDMQSIIAAALSGANSALGSLGGMGGGAGSGANSMPLGQPQMMMGGMGMPQMGMPNMMMGGGVPMQQAGQNGMGGGGSNVIKIYKVCASNEVDNELEGEIAQECSKFGMVMGVKVIVEGPDANVLVKFANAGEASKAVPALDGRWFGGRQIKCEQVSPSQFP